MSKIIDKLSTYKSVHLNLNNLRSHFIGIPLIVLSVFILLALTPVSLVVSGYALGIDLLAMILLSGYYLKLHPRLALGMILFMLVLFFIANSVSQWQSALWLAVALFVIGWIFQVIGHVFERAKPAFIDDLNQLLIGPLFLMAEAYFYFGYLSSLQDEVNSIALAKRQQINANS